MKKQCCRCHKDISDADFVGYCRSCVSDKGSYKLSDKIYVCKLWTYIYVENTDNKFCVINTDLIFENNVIILHPYTGFHILTNA